MTDATYELVMPRTSGHAARLVLMSCYLYYWCDAPVLDDARYDRIVKFLVGRWDKLKPLRKYQLGGVDEIAATGHHVLVSRAIEGGARAWHERLCGSFPSRRPLPESSWQWNRQFGLHLARLV